MESIVNIIPVLSAKCKGKTDNYTVCRGGNEQKNIRCFKIVKGDIYNAVFLLLVRIAKNQKIGIII